MDLRLPLLADINLHLGVAEEAFSEGDVALARVHVDKAEESFGELEDEPSEALFLALLRPLEERMEGLREDLRKSAPHPAHISEKQESSSAAS
jgi:hypothetical protein